MDNPDYFKTDQKYIPELTDNSINELYSKGYVFTRLKRGLFNQTRSLRINLADFELNSENRRVLKKNETLKIEFSDLPYQNYSWDIHKLGKDFYTIKFGDNVMSASKIKEMFLDTQKSNMNGVLKYSQDNSTIGYCLIYTNSQMVHYAYPFYDLSIPKELNVGMAMMLNAISWAKESGKQFIYLGSVVDSKAKYKLQFEGLEWFNTETQLWEKDLEKLKALLN